MRSEAESAPSAKMETESRGLDNSRRASQTHAQRSRAQDTHAQWAGGDIGRRNGLGNIWNKPIAITPHHTFKGRPGPSIAISLSHGIGGIDLSPSHISGEQSAVMASSRSSTQFAIGPAVG